MGLRAAVKEAIEEATKPSIRMTLDDPASRTYIRSFLKLRVMIGAIGLTLPLVTWFGAWRLDNSSWSVHDSLKGSLSGYYFSGMRDVFTGALIAIGVFLIAYKISEKRSLDNWASLTAGVAALFVAFFPTKGQPTTSLQDKLGSNAVFGVHLTAAIIFISALLVMSALFGYREGITPQKPDAKCTPQFWRHVHWACATIIAIGGLSAFLLQFVIPIDWTDKHHTWFGEVVCILAFGASWLAKGWEIRQIPPAQFP